MSILPIVRALALAAIVAVPAARAAAPETGRPYLKRPAATPAAVAAQVSRDPQLLARYAKHFHAAPAAVTAALKAARAFNLPPGTYTVWLTGPNGLRYPTVQTRAADTSALAITLKPGAPEAWLEAGTGNPMEAFRPVEEIVTVEAPVAPARVVEVVAPREILVAVGAK